MPPLLIFSKYLLMLSVTQSLVGLKSQCFWSFQLVASRIRCLPKLKWVCKVNRLQWSGGYYAIKPSCNSMDHSFFFLFSSLKPKGRLSSSWACHSRPRVNRRSLSDPIWYPIWVSNMVQYILFLIRNIVIVHQHQTPDTYCQCPQFSIIAIHTSYMMWLWSKFEQNMM